MKRSLLASPVLLLTLTAGTCGDDRPVTVLPPADLAICAEEGDAPALPAQDWTASLDTIRSIQLDRDLMIRDYIFDLRLTGGDCRAKVKGLATWRKKNGGR